MSSGRLKRARMVNFDRSDSPGYAKSFVFMCSGSGAGVAAFAAFILTLSTVTRFRRTWRRASCTCWARLLTCSRPSTTSTKGDGSALAYKISDRFSIYTTAVSEAVANHYCQIGAVPRRKCSVAYERYRFGGVLSWRKERFARARVWRMRAASTILSGLPLVALFLPRTLMKICSKPFRQTSARGSPANPIVDRRAACQRGLPRSHQRGTCRDGAPRSREHPLARPAQRHARDTRCLRRLCP